MRREESFTRFKDSEFRSFDFCARHVGWLSIHLHDVLYLRLQRAFSTLGCVGTTPPPPHSPWCLSSSVPPSLSLPPRRSPIFPFSSFKLLLPSSSRFPLYFNTQAKKQKQKQNNNNNNNKNEGHFSTSALECVSNGSTILWPPCRDHTRRAWTHLAPGSINHHWVNCRWCVKFSCITKTLRVFTHREHQEVRNLCRRVWVVIYRLSRGRGTFDVIRRWDDDQRAMIDHNDLY